MKKKEETVRPVGFDRLEAIPQTAYADGEVAFLTNLKELSIGPGSLRMDMHLLVACAKGRLQAELDSRTFTIGPDDLLVCRQNALVDRCLVSPDFEGSIVCLSSQVLAECVPGSELWKRAFCFLETPVIHTDGEALSLFAHYGEIIRLKIRRGQTAFRREIILALVRAILYEVMAVIPGPLPPPPRGEARVSEAPPLGELRGPGRGPSGRSGNALFRRFIELLSGMEVKPRSVGWYADRLCVTPKYLSVVCKAATGRTAFDWISEYVRADVRHALKHSDLSVKEMADRLGFPNLSFFGKFCRRHFGCSPGECRRRLQEDSGPLNSPEGGALDALL